MQPLQKFICNFLKFFFQSLFKFSQVTQCFVNLLKYTCEFCWSMTKLFRLGTFPAAQLFYTEVTVLSNKHALPATATLTVTISQTHFLHNTLIDMAVITDIDLRLVHRTHHDSREEMFT